MIIIPSGEPQRSSKTQRTKFSNENRSDFGLRIQGSGQRSAGKSTLISINSILRAPSLDVSNVHNRTSTNHPACVESRAHVLSDVPTLYSVLVSSPPKSEVLWSIRSRAQQRQAQQRAPSRETNKGCRDRSTTRQHSRPMEFKGPRRRQRHLPRLHVDSAEKRPPPES